MEGCSNAVLPEDLTEQPFEVLFPYPIVNWAVPNGFPISPTEISTDRTTMTPAGNIEDD